MWRIRDVYPGSRILIFMDFYGSKLWIWDPGTEIRDPEKTYSGSRIQGSKMHRIPDPGSGSSTLFQNLWVCDPRVEKNLIRIKYLYA